MTMDKETLRSHMAALPEPVTDKKPPHWEYWRYELWHHIVDGDDPDQFTTWPCVYHTMLHEHWMDAIAFERRAMGMTRANDTPIRRALDHQLYHIREWQRVSGKSVSNLGRILEFGGGFGAMAQVVRAMGFNGTYIICDLPEFALLQQFYLTDYLQRHHGFSVDAQWAKSPRHKCDLAIACYSLSETDERTRKQFEKMKAGNYLFLYNSQFADYDNVEYFNGFIKDRHDMGWRTWEIQHMPPTSIYSMGWS